MSSSKVALSRVLLNLLLMAIASTKDWARPTWPFLEKKSSIL